jgi:hypothetical protein
LILLNCDVCPLKSDALGAVTRLTSIGNQEQMKEHQVLEIIIKSLYILTYNKGTG